MKQINYFTQASQLLVGQPASFNQLLKFCPVIEAWVIDNTRPSTEQFWNFKEFFTTLLDII